MSRKSWDGVELMAALRSGAERLESRVAEVNALNVFPVPDGDTGTNMLATLKAAIAEGEATLAAGVTAIDQVSEAVARGALLGERLPPAGWAGAACCWPTWLRPWASPRTRRCARVGRTRSCPTGRSTWRRCG